MSVNGISRSSATRMIRKIEPTRPLKSSLINESKYKSSSTYSSLSSTSLPIESVEKLVTLMDMVVNSIMQNDDSRETSSESMVLLTANIVHLCKHLKIFGPQLENSMYQGQLDRAFLAFREGMVRGCLEYEARIHLLEIVELRDCQWIPRKAPSHIGNSYNHSSLLQSLQDVDDLIDSTDLKSHSRCYPLTSVDSTSNLGPEDVLKRSNKHRDRPIKIGSKYYYKDEIIIRNSDSGKVMGIKGRRVHMIEQLSETIISFQRVPPTAKERIVQITGPTDDRISYASRLIEDTIRSNSSPVRDLCGSESSYSSEESFNDNQDYENERYNDELLRDTLSTNLNLDPCPMWKTSSNKTAQPYQFKHKVIVKNCELTITGDDYTYVTVAKAILDDYFSKLRNCEYPNDDTYNYSSDVVLDEVPRQSEDYMPAPRDIYPESKKSHLPSSLIKDMSKDLTDVPINQDSFKLSRPKSLSGTSLRKPEAKVHVDATKSTSLISPEEIVPVLKTKTDAEEIVYPIPSLGENCLKNDCLMDSHSSAKHGEDRNVYTKEFLISCRESELSRKKPKDWEIISAKFPNIAKALKNNSEEYNAEGNSP